MKPTDPMLKNVLFRDDETNSPIPGAEILVGDDILTEAAEKFGFKLTVEADRITQITNAEGTITLNTPIKISPRDPLDRPPYAVDRLVQVVSSNVTNTATDKPDRVLAVMLSQILAVARKNLNKPAEPQPA